MNRLIFILLILCSCSVVDDFSRKQFVYERTNDQHKLILHIPKGFENEKVLLDTTGGKEQYYYYSYGALVYFSKNVSWTTENDSVIRKMISRTQSGNGFIYHGRDKDGLYWKEIRHENFRFGYSYVPRSKLDQFEKTINSIIIK